MIDQQKLTYEFGEFRLDVMKRQLLREGEVVPLYSKAFDLLLVLVQKGGTLLTKDELLEAVWPGQILEEANLTVTMSAVRKALGEKATQPHYIVNIPGRGYRFSAGVRDEAGAMVIERQTIARITVEEETTDDEIDSVAVPANLIASGEPEAAPGVGQLEVKQLAPAPLSSRRLFRRPAIAVALLALSAIIVVVSLYFIRQAQQARNLAARFTQIKVTQITNSGQVGNVAISPDGKFFAYTSYDRGNRLQVGQMNGERPIELLPPSDGIFRGLEYATDGSSLYYARQDQGQPMFAL